MKHYSAIKKHEIMPSAAIRIDPKIIILNKIPVLLPGKSHGQRSLVGCSPWGRWESDTTEWLHFHFLLSCIGEGNGNPFQCSCLENPRDGGAWWAAVYEVAQSRTRLKRLSSSSSSMISFASFNLSFKQTFPNSLKWSIAQICTFYSQF